MTTAANIIDRSLRLLGQTASGESATTNEYADGLAALNAMMDSWRNERTLCFATRDESLTLATNTGSYTIGPSGNLNTTRPVAIEQAWILASGTSYPVGVITDEQYAAISTKTTTGDWPDRVNYRPTMPTGTLYVWPVPKGASTLVLRTRVPLTAFAAITDTVTLPPGWEEALTYNLAIELAPEFQTQPSQAIAKRAVESLAAIKRLNSTPAIAVTDLALLFGRTSRPNILIDQ